MARTTGIPITYGDPPTCYTPVHLQPELQAKIMRTFQQMPVHIQQDISKRITLLQKVRRQSRDQEKERNEATRQQENQQATILQPFMQPPSNGREMCAAPCQETAAHSVNRLQTFLANLNILFQGNAPRTALKKRGAGGPDRDPIQSGTQINSKNEHSSSNYYKHPIVNI